MFQIVRWMVRCHVPAGDVGKCLGFWWKGDLLATRSIDENRKKARRAFFHYGSIGLLVFDLFQHVLYKP